MAVLMYESLRDFFDDYDMVDALKTGKALIIHRVTKKPYQMYIASMGVMGYVLVFAKQDIQGIYTGRAWIADEQKKLMPLFNNLLDTFR